MSAAEKMVRLQIGEAVVKLPQRVVLQNFLESVGAPRQPAVARLERPRIGEYWHSQGGVVVGEMRGIDGAPDYTLILPTDPAAYIKAITWGARGEDEAGAKCSFDGLGNTIALRDSKHSHPAAEWAAALEIDGHRDLYLPSRRELRLCWVNVPELFVDGWYWTSTQYGPLNAWTQYFGDGNQHYHYKGLEFAGRAVRRVNH